MEVQRPCDGPEVLLTDVKTLPQSHFFLFFSLCWKKKVTEPPWICARFMQGLHRTSSALYALLEDDLLRVELLHLKEAGQHLKVGKQPPPPSHL